MLPARGRVSRPCHQRERVECRSRGARLPVGGARRHRVQQRVTAFGSVDEKVQGGRGARRNAVALVRAGHRRARFPIPRCDERRRRRRGGQRVVVRRALVGPRPSPSSRDLAVERSRSTTPRVSTRRPESARDYRGDVVRGPTRSRRSALVARTTTWSLSANDGG